MIKSRSTEQEPGLHLHLLLCHITDPAAEGRPPARGPAQLKHRRSFYQGTAPGQAPQKLAASLGEGTWCASVRVHVFVLKAEGSVFPVNAASRGLSGCPQAGEAIFPGPTPRAAPRAPDKPWVGAGPGVRYSPTDTTSWPCAWWRDFRKPFFTFSELGITPLPREEARPSKPESSTLSLQRVKPAPWLPVCGGGGLCAPPGTPLAPPTLA